MSNILVAPSILSADFANLERDIKRVEEAGADWLHVDVMDGHFVPNITIGMPVVKALKLVSSIPLDVHLMIENPEKYIIGFAQAGADIITVHYEACKDNLAEVIESIKSQGVKVGVSIKPMTSPEVLYPYLNDIDLVLIMTVEPGFGGQDFMHHCAMKIPKIKELLNENSNLIIQVDGGINNITSKICISLGANCLVAGNYIYKSDDMKNSINSLKN